MSQIDDEQHNSLSTKNETRQCSNAALTHYEQVSSQQKLSTTVN